MTTALVTGGHGFVGTHLCALLESRGWDVIVLSRTPSATSHRRSVTVDLANGVGLDEALDTARPDVVFHLAGPAARTAADVRSILRDTVDATYQLGLALRRTGLHPRLVLAGSSAQYGDLPRSLNPVVEDSPFRPVSAYGYAKVAAEAITRSLFGDGTGDVIPVRPFNHVGPGEAATTVTMAVATRIAAVLRGRADRVKVSHLKVVRDLTDVRDIARGYLALAESGTPGVPYNLCSGRPVSVEDLVRCLLRHAGLDDSVIEVVGGPERGIAYQVGSAARVEKAIGWAASIPLEDSVADVLATVGVANAGTRGGMDA